MPTDSAAPVSLSAFQLQLRRFRANRLAMLSVGLLMLIVLACFLGPYAFPFTGEDADFDYIGAPVDFSSAHLFGTDDFGRDLLVRVLEGGRVSLTVGFLGIGLRGEIYRDEDGYTTGVGEPLSVYTGTLTVDMSPVEYFTTMLDVRVDGASRDLFQQGADETAPFQVTATLGAIVKTP